MSPLLEAEMYREEGGRAPGHVRASIGVDGCLEVEVKDVVRTSGAIWSDTGQKSWLKLSAVDKDRLLLALLKKAYGGRSQGADELRDFIINNGIQHVWESQA
jgi:hypothetical protein